MYFVNRTEAGRKLAKLLSGYAGRDDVIVLGVPRGGVPVAFEIAQALKAPLDVFLVRKLGAPGHEELAMGAISSGGIRILDHETIDALGVTELDIEATTAREQKELQRRERVYRGGRPPLELHGKTVIVVDDGIATGSSMRAGIKALRHMKPARIVVAVPVAPASTCGRLEREVDEMVCLETPELFYAIGQFYEDFSQVTDEEVQGLLRQAVEPMARSKA